MILAKISVLEIILYSLLAIGFTVWLIFTIKDYKKKKNGGKKKADEDED